MVRVRATVSVGDRVGGWSLRRPARLVSNIDPEVFSSTMLLSPKHAILIRIAIRTSTISLCSVGAHSEVDAAHRYICRWQNSEQLLVKSTYSVERGDRIRFDPKNNRSQTYEELFIFVRRWNYLCH